MPGWIIVALMIVGFFAVTTVLCEWLSRRLARRGMLRRLGASIAARRGRKPSPAPAPHEA